MLDKQYYREMLKSNLFVPVYSGFAIGQHAINGLFACVLNTLVSSLTKVE